MNKFADLGIKVEVTHFKGDKIKIAKVLNREITVHKFKIGQSQIFKGLCMQLHITVGETDHVIFTGSTQLQEQIKQVPPERFPFTTTIVQENEAYTFT
jgi:hypothetical protein